MEKKMLNMEAFMNIFSPKKKVGMRTLEQRTNDLYRQIYHFCYCDTQWFKIRVGLDSDLFCFPLIG